MSWEPINLAHLEPRPAIKPSVGGVNLIYPGKRHVFSGPPESAKTLAAYAIALDEIRLDGNVLLVDFEMGQWEARDRLREMGATDDELLRPTVQTIEVPDDDSFDDTVAKVVEHPAVLGTNAARVSTDIVVDVAIDDSPVSRLSESLSVCELTANSKTVSFTIEGDARVDPDLGHSINIPALSGATVRECPSRSGCGKLLRSACVEGAWPK